MEHPIAQTPVSSCTCRKAKPLQKQEAAPIWLGLLIAILPKCPFCVFGYSSVMVLCSGTKIQEYEPDVMSYLPLVVILALLGSMLWNFRDRRTWWALALVGVGGLILAHAQRITGSTQEYFTAVAFVFAGVFVNGSFLHFWKKITTPNK